MCLVKGTLPRVPAPKNPGWIPAGMNWWPMSTNLQIAEATERACEMALAEARKQYSITGKVDAFREAQIAMDGIHLLLTALQVTDPTAHLGALRMSTEYHRDAPHTIDSWTETGGKPSARGESCLFTR